MSLLTTVLMFSVAFGVASSECPSECPTFWTPRGGYCYRLFVSPQTWHHAEGLCQQSSTGRTPHLVSIHSYGENAFIKALIETTLQATAGAYGYWIGLNELNWPGNYRWSDNSVNNYQSWISGEPNNDGGRPEHCVEFRKASNGVGWNDKVCSNTRYYICKMTK